MICTIYIPWFGVLPFYAKDFLACCAAAKNILWVVHSDQENPLPTENIIWHKIENPTELIQRVFPQAQYRFWGHKLCDLKPYWNDIFGKGETEYWGWCDWDVYHNLSKLEFNFQSAKFTKGKMCSPLFIQKTGGDLQYYPVNIDRFLNTDHSLMWDEWFYLPHVDSIYLQDGLTPVADLFSKAEFAVHMYYEKQSKKLYEESVKKHCGFSV